MEGKIGRYAHGANSTNLLGQTLGVNFDAAAEKWGDRQALVVSHQNLRWTYKDLKMRVDAFAAGLISLGLEPGDRIGIWSQNNSEWVVTQYATAKTGLILVNINPAYRALELEYAINKVGCKALILSEKFKSSGKCDSYNAMLVGVNVEEISTRIDNIQTFQDFIWSAKSKISGKEYSYPCHCRWEWEGEKITKTNCYVDPTAIFNEFALYQEENK